MAIVGLGNPASGLGEDQQRLEVLLVPSHRETEFAHRGLPVTLGSRGKSGGSSLERPGVLDRLLKEPRADAETGDDEKRHGENEEPATSATGQSHGSVNLWREGVIRRGRGSIEEWCPVGIIVSRCSARFGR